MTKIAVISDIHANKQALDLILEDTQKRGVNKIYCLGDVVTKYFYPAQVVDAIKENCDIVIKGNCDDLVATNEKYKFARGKLGLDRIDYLDSLPTKKQLEINKVLVNLYHSNPKDLESMFNPLFNDNEHTRYKDMTIKTDEYNKMFEGDNPQTSIVGHTHMSYAATVDNDGLKLQDNNVIITPENKAILNAGSVGEHVTLIKDTDGNYDHVIDPFVTYIILDDNNLDAGFKAEIIKVPYSSTLVKVFYDSVDNQMNGNYPYSPLFTKRMEESINMQNNTDKVLQDVNDKMQEYNNFGKGR